MHFRIKKSEISYFKTYLLDICEVHGQKNAFEMLEALEIRQSMPEMCLGAEKFL